MAHPSGDSGPILRIAQFIPDTEAEGPGRRFAVWVQGCPLRCPGCCNPEMFPFSGGELVPAGELAARAVSTAGIEGLSLLGGEPFSQPAAAAAMASHVRAAGLTVMVFTGFTLAELRGRGRADVDALLAHTDLLVDGRFDREQPETGRRWIGSRNQQMHFLTAAYRPDDPRFTAPNTVEIRLGPGGVTVNGWPEAAEALTRWRRLP